MHKFILASQSPARLKILRDAGFDPIPEPSEVDEDAIVKAQEATDASEYVKTLAEAKALDVAKNHQSEHALILGADSALSFQGKILGKPHEPEIATNRWREMRGGHGELFTGQSLVDSATGKTSTMVSSTKVWFSNISDLQIQRYVSSKEPLSVAGAFTIDSLGGAFIDKIEGDYHTVVGLSLRLLREMLAELEFEYTDFWR